VGRDVLDASAVNLEAAVLEHLLEVSTVVLGETPLTGEEDLLPARELEHGTTKGLDNLVLVLVTSTDRHDDLADLDTGDLAVRLTKGTSHTTGQTIGTSAGELLVDTNDVEGVSTHAEVETVLTAVLGEGLVGGDTAGLKSLRGELLELIGDKVDDEGEVLDAGPLVTDVVDTDLGVGDTTAVPRLDVRLVLAVAVALGGAATHFDCFVDRLEAVLQRQKAGRGKLKRANKGSKEISRQEAKGIR
jgi:hypothetical protein